jgi:hypothetical protein
MSDQYPTQPGGGPGWQPPSQQPTQPWTPPPPPAAPPSWDQPPGARVQAPPPRKSRAWVTWVIALAAFGLGVAVGGAAAGDPEAATARTVTVTSIVERTVEVPVTTGAEAAPTTTAPKSKSTTAPVPVSFGDGQYAVPQQVKPGTYQAPNPDGECYWARLKGFSGELEDVIANDNPSGPARVTIARTDKGFESERCGQWREVG